MAENSLTKHESIEGAPSPDLALRSSKIISFHPGTTQLSSRGFHSKNYSNFSESAWESRESNSGYYEEKQTDADEGVCNGFFQRLYRFYEVYNPQKLNRVEEYLSAYKGEEEQLFAILTGKYGPEPQDPTSQGIKSTCSSENMSVMHYVGKRYTFPTRVSPQQGNTDCETPYWGNFNLITERDILGLFCNLDTTNEELQKCYIGLLAQHPSNSWNGMTYVTCAKEIAPSGTPFLGHIWAGSLSSEKVMVHETAVYRRVDLYCTENCQRSGQHERWRLSIYYNEVNSLSLLRVVWDPVIALEPLPDSHSAASLHSSSEPASLLGSSVSHSRSQRSAVEQPRQPTVASTLKSIATALERLEEKLCARFDRLEAKVSSLESKVCACYETTSKDAQN